MSTQLQSFNASSYVGNLELCGPPLTKDCPGDGIDPGSGVNDGNGSDKIEGDDDEFVSFGFYVSIGIGFFVGFWGVCGSLLLKGCWRSSYFNHFDNIKDWIYKRARGSFKPSLNTGH